MELRPLQTPEQSAEDLLLVVEVVEETEIGQAEAGDRLLPEVGVEETSVRP